MNFSDSVKKEILDKFNKDLHCKRAFLAGFVRGAGVLIEQDGEIGLELKMVSEQAKELVLEYLSTLFGLQTTATTTPVKKSKKHPITIYGDDVITVMTGLGVFTFADGEYTVNFDMYGDSIIEKDCCLRAFFRGLFLATGSCSVPKKEHGGNTKYHLELSFSHSAPAQATAGKLRKFDIDCKITRRKESYIVYVKSAESIKDFLALLPAPKSVLIFTDLMVEREISNRTNRQNNCIVGNISKQVDASFKQVQAIKKLIKQGVLDTLSEELKTTALARIESSGATLSELSQELNVSKSCLNHRLRKLVELADRL